MKAFVIALLGLAFIGIFGYVAWKPIQQALAPKPVVPTATNGVVVDFTSCEDNGNPVTESFPRTCRADGKTYTETKTDINPNGCRESANCAKGQFCNQGLCQDLSYNTSCSVDSDCQLVNQLIGWGCCYAGQCDPIDYNQSNWIAVNGANFTQQQVKYCPTKEQCGPMPGCPSKIISTNFVAACQQGVCAKTEKITPVPKKNPPLEPNN